jgi:hypothetical protein
MTDKPADLYGIAGAAAYLGVKEQWVWKLTQAGKLRYWQEVAPRQNDDGTTSHGSPLVFRREWLDEYQAKRRKPGRPAADKPTA